MSGKEKTVAKRLAVWIPVDLVLLGACLLTFAYFHHVRDQGLDPVALGTPAPLSTPAPTVTPEQTPAQDVSAGVTDDAAEPTVEPTATPNLNGLLKGKYAEKFTSGEILLDDTSYRSANVVIECSKVQTENPLLAYVVADVYIQDISSFKTAVSRDYSDENPSDVKSTMDAALLSKAAGALVSMSGDNFVAQLTGRWIVRNGLEWSLKKPMDQDICVLYYDGTMVTYPKHAIDIDAIKAQSPYQVWSFGPRLVVDGQVSASITGNSRNPRAAVGYFEPGHYCFVLADGRQAGYSMGATLTDLAKILQGLGCTTAYNLDGGDTAVLCFSGEWFSHPEEGSGIPRPCADILMITEPDAAEAAQ